MCCDPDPTPVGNGFQQRNISVSVSTSFGIYMVFDGRQRQLIKWPIISMIYTGKLVLKDCPKHAP